MGENELMVYPCDGQRVVAQVLAMHHDGHVLVTLTSLGYHIKALTELGARVLARLAMTLEP